MRLSCKGCSSGGFLLLALWVLGRPLVGLSTKIHKSVCLSASTGLKIKQEGCSQGSKIPVICQ